MTLVPRRRSCVLGPRRRSHVLGPRRRSHVLALVAVRVYWVLIAVRACWVLVAVRVCWPSSPFACAGPRRVSLTRRCVVGGAGPLLPFVGGCWWAVVAVDGCWVAVVGRCRPWWWWWSSSLALGAVVVGPRRWSCPGVVVAWGWWAVVAVCGCWWAWWAVVASRCLLGGQSRSVGMGVLTHERRRTTNVSSFVVWLPHRCQRHGTWYLCQKRKRRGVSTYLGWQGRCGSLPSDVAHRHALSATWHRQMVLVVGCVDTG